MKKTEVNAADAPATPGTYAQAISLNGAEELVFISGQIPADVSGAVPEGALAQAHQIWKNIDAQLRAAGMTKDNLVKVTIYLSSPDCVPAYREARDAYLDGRQIALTAVYAGIFDPAWLMEIEAIAAR